LSTLPICSRFTQKHHDASSRELFQHFPAMRQDDIGESSRRVASAAARKKYSRPCHS
jgi:hypothetical protein